MRPLPRLTIMMAVLVACGGDSASRPPETATLEIAYTRFVGSNVYSGSVWMVSSDGSSRRQLVDLPHGSEYANDWTPDGRTLLFTHVSDADESQTLWLVQADGGDLRPVPAVTGVALSAEWMSDGQRIMFIRRSGQREGLATMRADGSDLQWFLDGEVAAPNGFAWSPDGARIVFGPMIDGLWIADADGSNRRHITYGQSDALPRWSRDGSRIAYWSAPLGIPSRIAIVNPDGSGQRVVSAGPNDIRPTWAPDGHHLAYDRSFIVPGGVRCTIATIDLDGGAPHDLIPDVDSQWCPKPAWRSAPALH